MIDISVKIKDLRLEKNLKQKDVAKMLHIATNTLSQFENNKGRPSLEVLSAMADFYGCSIDYLVGRDDDYSAPTFYTSSEEQELIKAYRQLSFDQQQVVKVQLGALVEVNK